MTDATAPAPRRSGVRVALVGTLKLLAATVAGISLIGAVTVAAVLVVYLLSLLGQ